MARLVFSPPIHPGEILREQFIEPMGLSAGSVAKAIDVPRTRIERIVAEQTGITTDTALRLGKFFGTSPELWLNLQQSYDLEIGRARLGPDLANIKQVQAA
jgi:addiction module HigA family antidote